MSDEDEVSSLEVLQRFLLLLRMGVRTSPASNSEENLKEVDEAYHQHRIEDFQKSSFAAEIKQASLCSPYQPSKSLFHLLRQREYERTRSTCKAPIRTHVLQRFIPTKPSLVDEYQSKIFCSQFSSDGATLMTACQDRQIRLYNTDDWSLRKSIPAQDVGWSVLDTDYSPDQRFIIYSSWSNYVHLCSTSLDETIHESLDFEPQSSRFCLFSIQFSSDSTEIVGGSSDRCLYIYDLQLGKVTCRFQAHADDINSVGFADQTSQILFSASDDTTAKVWDRRLLGNNTANNHPVGVLNGHLEGITHVSSKGDARYLLTNSKDQSIKLWDMRKMSSSEQQEGEEPTRTRARSNWDYRYVEGPMMSNLRKKFDGKVIDPNDSSLMTYRGHRVFHTLIRAYFSPMETTGQRYIYSGSSDGSIYVYDILTGGVVEKLSGHHSLVRDVTWHPYFPLIASASWDGRVKKWDYDADMSFQGDLHHLKTQERLL